MKTMSMRKAAAGVLVVASGALLAAVPAFASEELFRKSNCMACHAIDQKRVGPSLKAVAAKYRGQSAAADMLARKVREGGVGVWGQLPMPPQPQVSEADALALAEYILSIQ